MLACVIPALPVAPNHSDMGQEQPEYTGFDVPEHDNMPTSHNNATFTVLWPGYQD